MVFLAALLEGGFGAAGAVPPDDFRLLISLEQLRIAAPYPARITLHFHNGGEGPVWVYRRVRSQATEGSTLEVVLAPLGPTASQEITTPARGIVFESVGLPRLKLARLGPGEDTTEKATIQLQPTQTGSQGAATFLWGRYRLSVVYRARYSNAVDLERILGIKLWQGEVTSNSIEIELEQPSGKGTISGSVQRADGRGLPDALVSLSDGQERFINQTVTDREGRYLFEGLPLGVYWVTVRRTDLTEDSTVFRHIELTQSAPAGSNEFIMYPPEIYEAQKVLHKPVLIRVTDPEGRPVGRVPFEVLWSNGPVIDNVKGETGEDGLASVELIPGRNFLTLRRRGCPKQDHRLDVAEGGGIDGFKLESMCEKK